MIERRASCRCGQLTATVTGEPVRTSVCHCLHCKKRSGSAFATQARWPLDRVVVSGAERSWTKHNDSGTSATFRFCPECGSDIAYVLSSDPEVLAMPVGAFDDPFFAQPVYSVFEDRKHPWVAILGEQVDHLD
ncbi:GFA family protein [Sphingomonas ginkgonis]|uniref:GFA family protein n=1 Tax=Sphingomonas ginkgonis TaxID=2315330 RepID=A0A429V623_9SPHN|nr:GFA family protein [Sphingomonas ginkgonis]RST29397.1 GFA family protein [Sphingomonas ginkgonis]